MTTPTPASLLPKKLGHKKKLSRIVEDEQHEKSVLDNLMTHLPPASPPRSIPDVVVVPKNRKQGPQTPQVSPEMRTASPLSEVALGTRRAWDLEIHDFS